MTQTLANPTFDRAGLDALVASQSEPGWLAEARQAAFQKFEAMQWPSRKDEDWMRSDLRLFKIQKYGTPGTEAEISVPVRLNSGIDAAGEIAIQDNQTVTSNLADEYAAKGVVFGAMSDLIGQHASLIQEHILSIISSDQDRFAALHAAFWQNGHFLYVPRNVVVDRPLHVISGMADMGIDLGHTLIVLDEGAEATFLHETSSPSETAGGFHCGGLEILLKENAKLRYVNLQDWGRNVWHFAHQKAVVHRDASIQWTIAAMGSRFAQVSQQVALAGKGAHSQVNGVMFTQDRQQLTYNTIQHHVSPHCTSDFLYKSALQDRSRTVWRGMIKVDPGANKTDGYQRNDNLLLSDQSRADSIPGLEILADDVRCTHGSTSGKVDEELIFYAQSRGFTRKEAVRMIVSGFFQQIFDRITIDSVREALGDAIARQVREYD